jgi:hypothetical protein
MRLREGVWVFVYKSARLEESLQVSVYEYACMSVHVHEGA